MKEIFSIPAPRPDYEEGTCKSDLDFMKVKYDDLSLQHITVLFKWVKIGHMIGYDEKKFLDGIENLRSGKFIIKEEDGMYKLYEK